VKLFLDTNVVVYAALSNDRRCATAERLLTAGGVLSVQVLNEFASVARTKLKWPWADIEAMLALVRSRSEQVGDISLSTCHSRPPARRRRSVRVVDGQIVIAGQREGGGVGA
jgi:predicted nucleic acid-binding protein